MDLDCGQGGVWGHLGDVLVAAHHKDPVGLGGLGGGGGVGVVGQHVAAQVDEPWASWVSCSASDQALV